MQRRSKLQRINKKVAPPRVRTVSSVSEFERTLEKAAGRLLLILFHVSTGDKKPVLFLNDLSRQPSHAHIDFALVEADLHRDIIIAAGSDGTLPEFRFYRGRELLVMHKADVSSILRDLSKYGREAVNWEGYGKKQGLFASMSGFAKAAVAGGVAAVGLGLVMWSGMRGDKEDDLERIDEEEERESSRGVDSKATNAASSSSSLASSTKSLPAKRDASGGTDPWGDRSDIIALVNATQYIRDEKRSKKKKSALAQPQPAAVQQEAAAAAPAPIAATPPTLVPAAA